MWLKHAKTLKCLFDMNGIDIFITEEQTLMHEHTSNKYLEIIWSSDGIIYLSYGSDEEFDYNKVKIVGTEIVNHLDKNGINYKWNKDPRVTIKVF